MWPPSGRICSPQFVAPAGASPWSSAQSPSGRVTPDCTRPIAAVRRGRPGARRCARSSTDGVLGAPSTSSTRERKRTSAFCRMRRPKLAQVIRRRASTCGRQASSCQVCRRLLIQWAMSWRRCSCTGSRAAGVEMAEPVRSECRLSSQRSLGGVMKNGEPSRAVASPPGKRKRPIDEQLGFGHALADRTQRGLREQAVGRGAVQRALPDLAAIELARRGGGHGSVAGAGDQRARRARRRFGLLRRRSTSAPRSLAMLSPIACGSAGERGRSGDEDVCACTRPQGCGLRIDTSIDLQLDGSARSIDQRANVRIFARCESMKLCPPKPGLTRHHENQVDVAQDSARSRKRANLD